MSNIPHSLRSRWFALLWLCLGLLPQVPAQAQSGVTEEAVQLLANMSRALRETDYRGLFTYEYGGALKTMRVTHQVTDGVEFEYLEQLNGPPVRIERSGASVDCLPPADRVLRGLLSDAAGNAQGLSQHYHFRLHQQERVADRLATVLQIIPRDPYRYGYTISIDRETHLPLAAIILNTNNRALERLQFSSLEFEPDDDWVEVVDSHARVTRPRWPQCGSSQRAASLPWRVSWVPSGFLSAGRSVLDGLGDVLLFTDGLAAFSVFVRPQDGALAAQGRAQRGATVAYMRQMEFNDKPYTVTVVGEIPARSAQRIATSVVMEMASPAAERLGSAEVRQ